MNLNSKMFLQVVLPMHAMSEWPLYTGYTTEIAQMGYIFLAVMGRFSPYGGAI